MRPQSCKSKGRRLQQKVASDIRDAFPHLKEDDCHSTPMGAHGEDVRLSSAARECVNLSIECKNVEKINIWECLQQCETNTRDGTTPCLVFSRNRTFTTLTKSDKGTFQFSGGRRRFRRTTGAMHEHLMASIEIRVRKCTDEYSIF